MNINDPNIAAIELVAAQLGTDLCKHMVFDNRPCHACHKNH